VVILHNFIINTACRASSKLLHPNPANVNLILMVMHYNLMESVLLGVPLNVCWFGHRRERSLQSFVLGNCWCVFTSALKTKLCQVFTCNF